MEVIIFEKEAYYKLLGELKNIFKEVLNEERNKKTENDWISLHEAMVLLNIKSKTTLQKYCNEGRLIYSKHGRKILYSKKSIVEFLNDNSINKKKCLIKKTRLI